MRVSLFKLGLVLIIAGAVWISFVFAGSEKTQVQAHLEPSGSLEAGLALEGAGVGYFSVHMPGFAGQEAVFVHVSDHSHNVIHEERIQTRMAVGYFDFEAGGTYTVRVTNVSGQGADVFVEAGDVASQKMVPPGVLVLAGAVTMMAVSYVRLRDYSMAHPDENIS